MASRGTAPGTATPGAARAADAAHDVTGAPTVPDPPDLVPPGSAPPTGPARWVRGAWMVGRRTLRYRMRGRGRPVTYAVNFATWKWPFMRRLFPDRHLCFVPVTASARMLRALERRVPPDDALVWGMAVPPAFARLAARRKLGVRHVEDGFIRSVGLGAGHVPPLSLCIDGQGAHFNPRAPSDLETLIRTHDFDADPALMARARALMRRIVEEGVTKYNLAGGASRQAARDASGERPRVLCVGQVEDDQSILFGCEGPVSNNDLVRLAARENPDADVLYKIHPDYLAGHRTPRSSTAEIEGLCRIVGDEVPLDALLPGMDRLYTFTSLSGFEALMRGVPVTTLGMPFYAGWGVTDDRAPAPERRDRERSVAEIFAAAYLLYPTYLDPETGERTDLEATLDRILAARAREGTRGGTGGREAA